MAQEYQTAHCPKCGSNELLRIKKGPRQYSEPVYRRDKSQFLECIACGYRLDPIDNIENEGDSFR